MSEPKKPNGCLITLGVILGLAVVGHFLPGEKTELSPPQPTPVVNKGQSETAQTAQPGGPLKANQNPQRVGPSPTSEVSESKDGSTDNRTDSFDTNVALFGALMAQKENSDVDSPLEPSRQEFEQTANSVAKASIGLGEGRLLVSNDGLNCYLYLPAHHLALILATRADDERLVHAALYFTADGTKTSAINILSLDLATIYGVDPTLSVEAATRLLGKLDKARFGGSKSARLNGNTYLLTKMPDRRTFVLEIFR